MTDIDPYLMFRYFDEPTACYYIQMRMLARSHSERGRA